MKAAYLALGSNVGDRWQTLRRAIEGLKSPRVTIDTCSAVYATEPVGLAAQSEFLNMVVGLRTDLPPEELLTRALEVEAQLGRVRRERWGPRTIDLDLLWYQDYECETSTLILPHPRMHERAFVLVPLAEISPDLILGGESVGDRVKKLDTSGVVRLGEIGSHRSDRDFS